MKRIVSLTLSLLVLSSCAVLQKKPKVSVKKQKKERLPSVKFKPDYTYYYMLYLDAASKGEKGKALSYIEKAYALSGKEEIGVEAARLAASLKKLKEAKEILNRVLKKNPKNPDALKLLAGIYVVEGKRKKAEELYRKVLKERKDRDAYVFLSNLLINGKDYDGALKVLKEAQKDFPNDYLIDYFTGQVYFLKGNYQKAGKFLEKSVPENPHFESSYILLGHVYKKLKNYGKAEEFLKKVLQDYPDNIYALKELLSIYVVENKPEEAVKVINKLVSLQPYNLKLLSWVAASLFQLKEYKRVIPIIERITKLNPDNPNVYFMLGLAYEMEGNLKGAVKAYEKSLSYYPNNPTVLERIGLVYYKMKEYSKAEESYEKLWLLTGNLNYLIKAAVLKDKIGDTEGAFNLLKENYDEFKNNPDFIFYYSYFADKLGKDKEAEEGLKKLLKIRPTPDVYNYLAYFYALRGKNLEEALKLVDRALKSKPESAAYMDTKGWILYKMGKYKKACLWLGRALKEMPDDPVINYHYGSCLLKEGKAVQARKYLKKALKLVKGNPEAESEEPGITEKIEKALKEIEKGEK